ncbi:uncharacterized protein LOC106084113 [Stomoxys calcitrans]|uniref:Single domain-containing protein n=1 Tax=Stomoxys calcitrans TaxID=35570 RepID=A0A1I8NTN5_STOCA|nr:uncharacterized protein LOC106084113 [Stomoxys calcitrans]
MNFLWVLSLVLAIICVQQTSVTLAVTEPVCAYRNSQDDTVFLKYLPLARRGEEYVDFGTDGKCVKKATCTDTFRTKVDECKQFPVTCSNKRRYDGVFPACCVKC